VTGIYFSTSDALFQLEFAAGKVDCIPPPLIYDGIYITMDVAQLAAVSRIAPSLGCLVWVATYPRLAA